MRKTLPDEHGWYWSKSLDGDWCMAFVNMDRETIRLFDDVDPRNDQIECPMDEFENSSREWYGPFNCPGTDFGEHTIVMEEKLHREAITEGKAMCVTFVDYQHCSDERHHSSIAITELRPRQDADELCHRNQRYEPPMLPSDNLVPLSQAAALVPTRPHYNTLRRWILRGSRGRKLSAQLIAGRWFTTPEAVTEFLETPANKIVVGRHATRQQTAAENSSR